jgi:hypothetical protein
MGPRRSVAREVDHVEEREARVARLYLAMARKLSVAFMLFVSAFTTSAHADVLADVKAALAALAGVQPLAASVDLTTVSHDPDDQREGHVTVRLRSGDGGLEMIYGPQLLQRLEDEKRLEGSGKQEPSLTAIRHIEIPEIAGDIDYAPALSRQLQRAHLTEQKIAAWQGQPARMLKFNVDVPLSEKDRKHVKEAAATLTLWIGADNVPLAAQNTIHAKARFMLISFEDNQTEDLTFAHWGDRLVVTRKVAEEAGSGMGQNSKSRQVQVITRDAGGQVESRK